LRWVYYYGALLLFLAVVGLLTNNHKDMKCMKRKSDIKQFNVGFYGSSGIEKTVFIFENPSKIRQDE